MSFLGKATVAKIKKYENTLREICDALKEALESAQDKFDSRSENWQESDAGAAAYEALNNLECLIDDIGVCVDSCENFSEE